MSKNKGGRPAYTEEEILEKLYEYLVLGYSIKKACLLGGIHEQTVYSRRKKDESFSSKLSKLMNSPNVRARAVWVKRIDEGDYQAAKDWLERREKNEFSLRQEMTGQDGEKLEGLVIIKNGG